MLESWSMKKFFVLTILSLIFSTTLQANTSDNVLKRDTETLGSILYLNTHNKGSKDIYIDKIKIWFSKCSNKTGNPDRIYRIGRTNRSYSDLQSTVTTSWNYKGSYCYNLDTNFVKPRTFKSIKPKPKSGAQKWLDKIRGN